MHDFYLLLLLLLVLLYLFIIIFFLGGGGGGGGYKSTRIFCMGVHDILSMYVWGVPNILGGYDIS